MQKIRCFILDDEFYSRNILKDHIALIPFLEFVEEAEDPITAYSRIQELRIDLLFLDIDMPNISGIAFLEQHPNLPLTIMTTAHPEHALETYKFRVIDYLLKPISFEGFYRGVLKAQDYLKVNENTVGLADTDNYFYVKIGTKLTKVIFDELLFAEALDNYVVLHTTTQKLMVYMTFKDIITQLSPKKFIKIHKSYVVNIDKIENIGNDEVKIGTLTLPVSRNFRNDLIQAIQHKIVKKL